jgi:hypothetical protein
LNQSSPWKLKFGCKNLHKPLKKPPDSIPKKLKPTTNLKLLCPNFEQKILSLFFAKSNQKIPVDNTRLHIIYAKLLVMD